MDPEEVLGVMNGLFEALLPEVEQNGGMIARLMGDAVLAFFGAPVAHEDDPERAVRAALALTARAREYADRLRRERSIPEFAVRVGINTGLVVVGDVGANQQAEYTAMGDAVNMAARMQGAAPPGGILITHDTYRHVLGRFDVAPQPPLSVKGHTAPVRTYLVLRAKSTAFPMNERGVEGIATRMIGRDGELRALQRAYEDAAAGLGARFVTVVGDAGIGKSRLLDELVAWADLRPESIYYWRGRCARVAESTPYGLLRDLFARRFGILDSDPADVALARFREQTRDVLEEEQADLAGHLAGFDFSSSPAVGALLGSSDFGAVAVAALRQALRALWRLEAGPSRDGDEGATVLLLLQDVHWADDASLDLIAGLLAEAPHARVFAVAAARPEFYERRADWGAGLPGYSRVNLWPLSRRNSRALVSDILQRVPAVPDSLREMLVDAAEGNPFYLEELIKMLIEDGAIVPGLGEWRIDPEKLGQAHLPPTLTAVLQARLDGLPRDERLVLQRASVAGRQFWDELVRGLAPEVSDTGEALTRLQGRELIYPHGQRAFAGVREYIFKHAILQQVTYETVLLQTRRACHAQVARWLEAHAGGRLGEYFTVIAEHYRQAGHAPEAADWYIRAGQRAAALGANRDARRFFETALELLPPDDHKQRWRALAAHDEVVAVLGDSPAREADDAALLALALRMGDDNRLAEAHYRRGYYLQVLSRYPESLDALNEAIAAAERSGNQRARGRALPIKMLTLTRLGRMTEAGAVAVEALATAEALGNPEILARALHNVAIYHAMTGDLARAVRLIERQAEMMEKIGNLVGEAASRGNLGYNYLLLGRHDEARVALQEALTLTEVIDARREKLYNQLNLGLACWRMGDDAAAQRLLEEAIPQLEAVGDGFAAAAGRTYLGLALERCDAPAAAAAFSQAHSALSALGVAGYAADALAGSLRCALAQDDLPAVRPMVETIWQVLREGSDGMELPMLAYETCARAFLCLGESALADEAAAAGYRALMEQADRISEPAWRESFLRNITENRALIRRHDAERHDAERHDAERRQAAA